MVAYKYYWAANIVPAFVSGYSSLGCSQVQILNFERTLKIGVVFISIETLVCGLIQYLYKINPERFSTLQELTFLANGLFLLSLTLLLWVAVRKIWRGL
jgi:hypothetical protein